MKFLANKYILSWFIIFLLSCHSKISERNISLEGKSLPQFTLQNICTGNLISPYNNSSGKAVALFYFQPHCPYCRATLSDLSRHKKELKNIDFYLITSSNNSETQKLISKFNLKENKQFIVTTDTGNFIISYYTINAIPNIVIYNSKRKFVTQIVGQTTAREISKILAG